MLEVAEQILNPGKSGSQSWTLLARRQGGGGGPVVPAAEPPSPFP